MKIDVERAAALWADGMSIKGMSDYFGIHPSSMGKLIHQHRAAFPLRAGHQGKANPDVPDGRTLMEMIKTRSKKSIADQYGVSLNTIDGRIRRTIERDRIYGTPKAKAAGDAVAPPVVAPKRTLSPDRVLRKTSSGALVTLYRVPSIDGTETAR
jgi:hypothetical protein